MSNHNEGVTTHNDDAMDTSTGVTEAIKGKGKAVGSARDDSMMDDDDDDDDEEEEEGEDEEAPDADDDEDEDLAEIDTTNIVSDGRRTRGKNIDFSKVDAGEEDEDEEDDEDFEDPDESMEH